MAKKSIEPQALKAVGPYSVGVAAGNVVYVSGQLPIDGATGKLVEGDVSAQARQCLENMKRVLDAAGLGFGNVAKTTVFLTSMADFGAMNDVYKTYVVPPYPARSTVEVRALPLGALVEIEAIAHRDD